MEKDEGNSSGRLSFAEAARMGSSLGGCCKAMRKEVVIDDPSVPERGVAASPVSCQLQGEEIFGIRGLPP